MDRENKADSEELQTVYSVLDSPTGPFEIREKASRFISFAECCDSVEEAEIILNSFRKRHFDSTHVCYGFRVRDRFSQYRRSSDDGEPSGTAGMPILQEIMGRQIWNVLVMVVRYYGGTKLGTGGLVRAYGGAARLALESAQLRTVEMTERGKVAFPFNDIGLIMQWLNRHRGKTINQECDSQGIVMTCSLPLSELDNACRSLVDISSGRLSWLSDSRT